MMSHFIPKWHRELDIFHRVKPLIIIEGNVLDVYQYPEEGSAGLGSVLRLTQYLHYYFHDCGYQDIVFFDSLNGITNPCEPESVERFGKIAHVSLEKQTIKADFRGKNGAAAYAVMLLCKIVQFDLYGINWKIYAVVILLVLFRSFADKYNYKTIPVSDLKPGMILSMGSILLFAKSRVKGLPTFSTEDLKSRLSAEEVDSINRWSKTTSGQESIAIVRKIPFALFIGVGTLLFAVWEVLVG